MKKVVSLFLALLLCLTLLPGPVWAASGSCGSDMNWTLSSGCLTITGGGTMTSTPWKTYSSEIHSIIVRPDDGWSLDLADHAFSDLTNLTEVEIKQGVTTISEYAFSGCGKLRYLSLPMYVTVVLPYAFSGCTSLEYVSYAGETDSLSMDKGNEDLARCLPVRPYIYSDPTNVTVNEGGVATFSVKASGSDIPNYQWQYWSESGSEWVNVTASDITGAESATMKVPGKASRNGMEYRCEVTNSYGTNWSSHATLTVKCKPTITTQPSSKTVSAGTNAKFSVVSSNATGYQWQYWSASGSMWVNVTASDISGAKSATMTVPATTGRSGVKYRCQVKNANGTTNSNSATLTVTSASKPSITTQPSSKTVSAGTNAKFSVVASNAAGYQWQYWSSGGSKWVDVTASDISGAKTATMTVPATAARNGIKYRCQVKNSAGTTNSNSATLTVKSKPTITSQPSSKTVSTGTNAKFSVVASNASSYQWQYWSSSGSKWVDVTAGDISGAKTATMTVPATAARNGMKYRCQVKNSVGTTNSNSATLTVKSKPTITSQPSNKTVSAGVNAKFSVVANNASSYQWQYWNTSSSKWVNVTAGDISGAKTATMTVPATKARNGMKYRCQVTNSVGTTNSSSATLTVN